MILNPHLGREILTHLAYLPDHIKNRGNSALPDMSLSLGKLLYTTSHWTEGKAAQPKPLRGNPRTVSVLGWELWQAGIRLIEQPELQLDDHASSYRAMRAEIQSLKVLICETLKSRGAQ